MSDQNRVINPMKEADSVEPTDIESSEVEVSEDVSEDRDEKDEGPVRRPLIRATLEHPKGTPPPPRQAPVFTMHQQERGGSPPGRGSNRNGRFVRDAAQSNKKKGSRDRQGQSQNASTKGNSSGGRKRSSRPDRSGQPREASGNRSSPSRRDKGRSR